MQRLKRFIKRKQKAILSGLAICLLAAAAVVLVGTMNAEDDATKDWVERIWYYDLNTNKLFAGEPGQIPPIDAPSGPHKQTQKPAGVKAHVLGCGDCSDKNIIISYLEAFPPKVRDEDTNSIIRSHVIRATDGEQWIDANSAEAKQIKKSVRQKCQSELVRCFPGNVMRKW